MHSDLEQRAKTTVTRLEGTNRVHLDVIPLSRRCDHHQNSQEVGIAEVAFTDHNPTCGELKHFYELPTIQQLKNVEGNAFREAGLHG